MGQDLGVGSAPSGGPHTGVEVNSCRGHLWATGDGGVHRTGSNALHSVGDCLPQTISVQNLEKAVER